MREWRVRGRWAKAGVLAVAVAAGASVACARDAKSDQAPDPKAERANLDFSLKDMNGTDVKLADLKGRPILINFWATWCGPCKLEIPALIELADQYRSRNLTVLGVSIDDSPEDLRKFAAEYKINYPVLVGLGHDELMEAYDALFGVPVSVFIRRDGTVLVKHAGAQTKEWLETQIKALL